jgi:type II secretory pathway pseudopilin PulG
MNKPQNKKGILLTEILVAMVLITLIVVGGFQAITSWKDSAHQHNTAQSLISHIPSALDQVMVNTGQDAKDTTMVQLEKVTVHAAKTSWGGTIGVCAAKTAGQFCIDVALPTSTIATDLVSALEPSTSSAGGKSILSAVASGTSVKVKYGR